MIFHYYFNPIHGFINMIPYNRVIKTTELYYNGNI